MFGSIEILFLSSGKRSAVKAHASAMYVLMFCVAAVFAPTASWAAKPQILSVQGPTALAQFDNTSSDGCITTFVSVGATDGAFNSQPGAPNASPFSFADVFIVKQDQCSFTLLMYVTESVTLTDSDFTVFGPPGPALSTARLNATVEVFDQASWSPVQISIDLTWTGSGTIDRIRTLHTTVVPAYHELGKFFGTVREAQATGSVSDGIVNLTPSPSVFAMLQDVTQGLLTISK